MARPIQKGLNYFGFDCDFFTRDDKILDLKHEYGPIGLSVYISILCKVYANGYYLKRDLDKLASDIVEIIGSRFIKKSLTLQVIQYCGHIGLFDDALLRQSVITSVSIQKRYLAAKSRSKVQPNSDDYWLVINDENDELLISARKSEVNTTITGVNVTKTRINVTKTPIKEKKSKVKNKEYSAFFESVWDLYPNKKGKGQISDSKKAVLYKLGYDHIKKAINRYEQDLEKEPWRKFQNGSTFFNSGYVDYLDDNYVPVREKKETPASNKFFNFTGRDIDFDKLEQELIEN